MKSGQLLDLLFGARNEAVAVRERHKLAANFSFRKKDAELRKGFGSSYPCETCR